MLALAEWSLLAFFWFVLGIEKVLKAIRKRIDLRSQTWNLVSTVGFFVGTVILWWFLGGSLLVFYAAWAIWMAISFLTEIGLPELIVFFPVIIITICLLILVVIVSALPSILERRVQ